MNNIKAISISERKGTRKTNIQSTRLLADFGLENDAHGGTWHRQVSLLAEESIASMRAKGLDVVAGNFAENITTEGIDLTTLEVGRHLRIGPAELVISQLGKICHTRCAIYHQAGDCVMPREGIFAVVLGGGIIQVGDTLTIENKLSKPAAIIGSKDVETTWGDRLLQLVREKFQPVFVRFDAITSKEGGSLGAILDDLTMTQKIPEIIVMDPTGTLGLGLAGYRRHEEIANRFQRESSSIYLCRSIADLERLPISAAGR